MLDREVTLVLTSYLASKVIIVHFVGFKNRPVARLKAVAALHKFHLVPLGDLTLYF